MVERNFWDTTKTDYSVTKGSLLAIFKHADAVKHWIISKNLYVQLSFNIESHMSTTNISASDNQSEVFNLNCITAGVGKFIIQF